MAGFGQYIQNIKNSAVSIFEGMAVTFSWMFRRPTTIQYPDKTEKPVREILPERSRGILEVDVKTCIADSQCMRTCPIGVILIEYGKTADGKGRTITRFDIDASKCMYCGLCTEVCPTEAIRHTHEFEGCSRDVRNLVLHFVDDPVPPYKLQKDVTPETPPLGEILRTRVLKEWDAAYRPWEPKAPPPAPPVPPAAPKTESKPPEPAKQETPPAPAPERPPEARPAEAKPAEQPGAAPGPTEAPAKPAEPEPLPVPEGIRAGDIVAAVEKAQSAPPQKAPETPAPLSAVPATEDKPTRPLPEPDVPPKNHVVEAIDAEKAWTTLMVKTPEPSVVSGHVDLTPEPTPVHAAAEMTGAAGRPEEPVSHREAEPEDPGYAPPPDDPGKPMIERFLMAMPGAADCKFCGYASCRDYANALATRQEFEHDLCEKGGRGTAERIWLLLKKMKKKETVKTE